MRAISFMTAARRLLPLARECDIDRSEIKLLEFYNKARELTYRSDAMLSSVEQKPGFIEWTEFRADIHTNWSRYFDAIWSDPNHARLYYPGLTRQMFHPDIIHTINYLSEVVGEQPRRGKNRWMDLMNYNIRLNLQKVPCLSDFLDVTLGLCDNNSVFKVEYRKLHDTLLEEYVSNGFVKTVEKPVPFDSAQERGD